MNNNNFTIQTVGQLLFWGVMSLFPALSTLTNGRSSQTDYMPHSWTHPAERLADRGHRKRSLPSPGWSQRIEPGHPVGRWSADAMRREGWIANATGARPSRAVLASWPSLFDRNEWLHKS
jgi:hypothetical protein